VNTEVRKSPRTNSADIDTNIGEDRDVGTAPMVGQKRMLSVTEFCHLYGVGKTMAYAEMAAGHLPFVKKGKRRLIPVDGAEAWAKPAPTLES
jgi:excisionase family DNA binding protein